MDLPIIYTARARRPAVIVYVPGAETSKERALAVHNWFLTHRCGPIGVVSYLRVPADEELLMQRFEADLGPFLPGEQILVYAKGDNHPTVHEYPQLNGTLHVSQSSAR